MIAYKFRSGKGTRDGAGNDVFKRDIQLLSQDTIYIPTVEQLNDPAEALVDDRIFLAQLDFFKKLGLSDGIGIVKDSFRSFYDKIRSTGIFSLSKKIDNELMWAYYASGHCGYAIIFDTDVLAKSYDQGKWGGMYEFDMHYSSHLPRFDIGRVGKEDVVKTLSLFLGNKSKAWKHEAEHRLVFEKGGQCLKIDYRAIKGFVFGCRMSDDAIDQVMKTFSGRDLRYYQVALEDNSYKLTLKRLEDKYPTAENYCPNHVQYDLEDLLEKDKFVQGVGYKYRSFVDHALQEVCREPFVTSIYQIVVSDDQKYPHVVIWANVDKAVMMRPAKSFEFDLVDGAVICT